MRPILLFLQIFLLTGLTVFSREYHISVNGDDRNQGTKSAPFKTISNAAALAMPGDVIIVHEGVYREWVNPARGGTSDDKRIVYRAAENEKVVIKGSEIIKNWKKFKGDVWKVSIPNTFFGDFNPYKEIIHGDWFNDYGRVHHPGQVYLNGKSFFESHTLEGTFHPHSIGLTDSTFTWYCEVGKENTFIYANFHGKNPDKERVEINVRQTCFYPSVPGINYISVSGFIMSQAATPWAPPTAEQPGLLGTHWSKGWIIENNRISESRCVGITLGKDRKTGQNVWSKNPCKDGATHYNEVIFRALDAGWSKENTGAHIVRNNTIFNCEQAGIVGSLGAVFSQIYNNHIYNIWTKRQFSGAEIAGIKIHAPIDVLIKNNRIHNTGRGIWLDWMTQGTRVTENLCYDNTVNDLFIEVSHGPFMIDNNIFLSPEAIRNWSEGSIFVHNFIAGRIMAIEILNRYTPYHFPHSTRVAGLKNTRDGLQKFYNNIFIAPPEGSPEAESQKDLPTDKSYGLSVYNRLSFDVKTAGNVYLGIAGPSRLEADYVRIKDFDAKVHLKKEGDKLVLRFILPGQIDTKSRPLISTGFLGRTKISGLPFENPDGTAMEVDKDYFGRERDVHNPAPGPFSGHKAGEKEYVAWPFTER